MKPRNIVFFLILFSSIKLLAWGNVGHRTIGYIAEQYLDSKTKQEIQKVLGTESLADVSTWADTVRDDSRYVLTKNYHFQNLANRWTSNAIETNADITNAIKSNSAAHYQVGAIEAILSAEQKLRKLQYSIQNKNSLKFLVHFVGDIHQPLHTGFKKDVGGNIINVNWKGYEINLHQLWDSVLINEHMPTNLYAGTSDKSKAYAIYLVKKYNNKLNSNILNLDVNSWFHESYVLQTQIHSDNYIENIESYEAQSVQIIEQRLFSAGVRLAGMLNSIYANKEIKPNRILIDKILKFLGNLNQLINLEAKY